MVLVPGLLALGMLPLQTALAVMVAGMALALVGWGVIDKIQGRPHQPIAGPWRFFKAARCDLHPRVAFFTDLDANPRNLTAGDVPRPLGASPFVRGALVENEPEIPPSGSSR